ncbi:unnamed protein product [Boreogadus saida]
MELLGSEALLDPSPETLLDPGHEAQPDPSPESQLNPSPDTLLDPGLETLLEPRKRYPAGVSPVSPTVRLAFCPAVRPSPRLRSLAGSHRAEFSIKAAVFVFVGVANWVADAPGRVTLLAPSLVVLVLSTRRRIPRRGPAVY